MGWAWASVWLSLDFADNQNLFDKTEWFYEKQGPSPASTNSADCVDFVL